MDLESITDKISYFFKSIGYEDFRGRDFRLGSPWINHRLHDVEYSSPVYNILYNKFGHKIGYFSDWCTITLNTFMSSKNNENISRRKR